MALERAELALTLEADKIRLRMAAGAVEAADASPA